MRQRARGTAIAFLLALTAPAVAQSPMPAAPPLPPPAPNSKSTEAVDAFSAYQRGFYLTAFTEAGKRAQQGDATAMTLLGLLYAQGQGVSRDDLKAAQWYKQAASLGDREALFALAMFSLEGRAGPRSNADAVSMVTPSCLT